MDGKRFDIARLGSYGEEGVLALFSDSTNVEREGYTVSERQVGATLREILQEKQGRVIVAVFASNLHRIQQLIHIAREFGRKVLLNGKSMIANVRIARELGYLDFTMDDEISIQDLQYMPDSQVLMLTTGSAGRADERPQQDGFQRSQEAQSQGRGYDNPLLEVHSRKRAQPFRTS